MEDAYQSSEEWDFGWRIAEGVAEDYNFQLRLRSIPECFVRSAYPVRINIFWKMQNPLPEGLASMGDLDLMHEFEDEIIRAVEIDSSAVLVAILTGRGEREFVFQINSVKTFGGKIGGIPQRAEPYPIEIYSADDPAWEYFDGLVETIGQ